MKKQAIRIAAALLAVLLLMPTALAADTKSGSDGVRISEMMYKNHATLQDSDGDFSDWFELENTSNKAVSLKGWSVSDGKTVWDFPAVTLQRGELLVVFASGKDRTEGELHTSFALGEGESLYLLTPDGTIADRADCDPERGHDYVLCRDASGEFVESAWATPGYENTLEGYEAFCSSREPASDLIINEVMTANGAYNDAKTGEKYDWVELKNVSKKSIRLSDYCLSDSRKDLLQWTLPNVTLAAGQTVLIYCTGEDTTPGTYYAPFALNGASESVYLTRADETTACDFVWVHDLPRSRSMGRVKGQTGFFYLWDPTPKAENGGASYRYVSEMPTADTESGVYDNCSSLQVTLSGIGDIYYTTDGSAPTAKSTLYTDTLTIEKTTVLRAVCIEEGGAPSRTLTLNYFLNEGHSLPVVSLVTDTPSSFKAAYEAGTRDREFSANLAFFEDGGSFSLDCGVELKGHTSLSMPKKSLGVSFRSCYGTERLSYDIFGSGTTEFSSLSLRAGQDYPTTVFRSELMQELCLQAGEETPTQRTRYCVLYINGKYYGIYCLKDDLTRQYYADRTGTAKEDVEMVNSPVSSSSSLYKEAFAYTKSTTLSYDEAYERFCEAFDIDSMVDWFLFEGYCCNVDLHSNLRYFRTKGGKWQVAFYDLDWAFQTSENCFTYICFSDATQISQIIQWLLKSEDFRDRVLTRYAELIKTTLSNENVLSEIDAFHDLLAPEMTRERKRWYGTVSAWEASCTDLRNFFIDNDYETLSVKKLCSAFGVNSETRMEYFGF